MSPDDQREWEEDAEAERREAHEAASMILRQAQEWSDRTGHPIGAYVHEAHGKQAHEDAHSATHSPEQAEKVPADAGDAERARVAKYAEAIRSHRVEAYMASDAMFGWQCLTCGVERAPFTRSVEVAEQDGPTHHASILVAIADSEQAALVEEIRSMGRDALTEAQAYRALFAENERLRESHRIMVAEYEPVRQALLAQQEATEDAEAALAEARAQVEAVRVMHSAFTLFEPCATSVHGCDMDACYEDAATGEFYHSDEPVERACANCRDEDGGFIEWPCETAEALSSAAADTPNGGDLTDKEFADFQRAVKDDGTEGGE